MAVDWLGYAAGQGLAMDRPACEGVTVEAPLWPVLLLMTYLSGRLFYASRTAFSGVCPSCGYSLAGLAKNAKCPECGKTQNG